MGILGFVCSSAGHMNHLAIMNSATMNIRVGFPGGSDGKESACNVGDMRDLGSIPGSGRSPGGGQSNPLQYSCLENPPGQRTLVV